MKIEVDAIIGRTYTVPELREQFDALFLAVGAGLPVFMNVPGENYKGVYSANEYLTRVNLMGAWNPDSKTPILHGQRVVVVGGGNVAMDSVRTARRLGADGGDHRLPPVVGRASRPQGGGPPRDRRGRAVRATWSRRSRSSRTRTGGSRASSASAWSWASPTPAAAADPVKIEGSEFVIDCDLVVVAIGTRANPLLTGSAPELTVNEWGYLVTDEYGMTSLPGVFAGGDIVRGRRHGDPRHGRRQALGRSDRFLAQRCLAAAARGQRCEAGEGRAGRGRLTDSRSSRLIRRATDLARRSASRGAPEGAGHGRTRPPAQSPNGDRVPARHCAGVPRVAQWAGSPGRCPVTPDPGPSSGRMTAATAGRPPSGRGAARLTPSSGTRSCVIVSRSRTVTAPSSSESTSTVTHHGVPISSWRRYSLPIAAVSS